MKRIGVIGNRDYAGLADVVGSLSRVASRLGLCLVFERDLHAPNGSGEVLSTPTGLSAMITLGGDGTMLRGARFLMGEPVPLLGVNLGRLGFLTCCGPDEMELAVEHLVSGDFIAEPRMTLAVRAVGLDGRERGHWFALNDAVIHQGGVARMIQLRVAVNGEHLAAYAADGLIISTPTGSTAYNLSSGGPIIVPTVESILLTAISPHTLAVRPLLVPPTAEVQVRVERAPDEVLVTVDGQIGGSISAGDAVHVSRSTHPILLVRFPAESFFSRLRRKLGWGGLAERDETQAC